MIRIGAKITYSFHLTILNSTISSCFLDRSREKKSVWSIVIAGQDVVLYWAGGEILVVLLSRPLEGRHISKYIYKFQCTDVRTGCILQLPCI